MTVKKYIILSYRAHEKYSQWRLGQAFYNTLFAVRPDLARQVTGKCMLDPFYKDSCIPAFISFIKENW